MTYDAIDWSVLPTAPVVTSATLAPAEVRACAEAEVEDVRRAGRAARGAAKREVWPALTADDVVRVADLVGRVLDGSLAASRLEAEVDAVLAEERAA
jgi:hypothetical protein